MAKSRIERLYLGTLTHVDGRKEPVQAYGRNADEASSRVIERFNFQYAELVMDDAPVRHSAISTRAVR
jgi:hypothetical protein